MIRQILLLTISLLFTLSSQASILDKWNIYLAYHHYSVIEPAHDTYYALADGNLLNFDPETQEVQLLSKLTGLTGKQIEAISYSPSQHCLVTLYADGNIDLIYDDQIINLNEFANSESKNLNFHSLTTSTRWACVATDTGILLIDLQKAEIHAYYHFNQPIRSAIVVDQYIYAIKDNHLYRQLLANNPHYTAEWEKLLDLQATPHMCLRNSYNHLLLTDANGLHVVEQLSTPHPTLRLLSDLLVQQIASNAGRLLIMSDKQLQILDSRSLQTIASCPRPDDCTFALPTKATSAATKRSTKAHSSALWACTQQQGIHFLQYKDDQWHRLSQVFAPTTYGPPYDFSHRIHFVGDRLLLAGGRITYKEQWFPPVAAYFENNKWHDFQIDQLAKNFDFRLRNVTQVEQDPQDANHHFIASTSGLFEFRNKKFIQHYGTYNSPMRAWGNGTNNEYLYIASLAFDRQNQLWLNSAYSDTTFYALNAQHKWEKHYNELLKRIPNPTKLLFDQKGRLWVINKKNFNDVVHCIYCIQFDTPKHQKITDVKLRTEALNQDGKTFKFGGREQDLYDMAEDAQGHLWIASSQGVFVIDHPELWCDQQSNKRYAVMQPKVPRNDGTNFADYLLSDQNVTAIAIDGANRKWCGTAKNGIFLVNPEGTEIIDHFTIDNSPLLSNTINSLAIQQQTGQVMIATAAGLCSYQSQATAPQDQLEQSKVEVYPNPVRPDFNGPLTINRLTENAEVKITTITGQVVAVGRSLGGTFTWDLTDFSHRRVAPGVYLIYVSTAQADKGIVAKVAVI